MSLAQKLIQYDEKTTQLSTTGVINIPMAYLDTHNGNQNAKINGAYFPTIFGLRSPVIQKPFSPKKGIPLSQHAWSFTRASGSTRKRN